MKSCQNHPENGGSQNWKSSQNLINSNEKHPHGSGPSAGKPNIKMKSFKTQPGGSGGCLWVIFSKKIGSPSTRLSLKKNGDIVTSWFTNKTWEHT